MVTLALYLASLIAPATSCETIGPRLDATYVTICAGRVVRTTDSHTGVLTYLAPRSR